MPLKVTENAWVKVPPKPQRRRRQVDPIEQREALCAPLRYFGCVPMGSKDRIRMLSRPVSGMSGMVDVDRTPSPVNYDEGAGLMFANGSRGGSNGGRRNRRIDRVISEPIRVIAREPSIYGAAEREEELVEVIEEASTVNDDEDDRASHRSHRTHRSHVSQRLRRPDPNPEPSEIHRREDEPDPIPIPLLTAEELRSVRSISPPPPSVASYKSRREHQDHNHDQSRHRHYHHSRHDDYHCCSDMQSTRSASPPPPASIASYKIRRREPLPPPNLPASQARTPHQYRTVSTPSAAPRPLPTSTSRTNHTTSSPSGYKFESAIFQPRPSSNHYRDIYRNRGGNATTSEGGRWASATSALDFD